MLKTALKYSVICGGFLLLLFFVSMWLGSNPLVDVKHFFFDLIVFFVFIYFAGREYRDFSNDGILHFWQGINIGLLVFLPAVIFFVFVLYVLIQFDSSIILEYKNGAKVLLESNREFYEEELGTEDFEKKLISIESTTTFQLIVMALRNKLFSAFLITPVVSIFLRKKPNY